jgi:hypothetical protein
MRLGCFGCLFLIVLILILAVVALGVIFLSTNIFAVPDTRPSPYSKADGWATQQKLYEIAQRQAGRSSRKDPIAITEAEANAFLTRHLEQQGLPLSQMSVRFTRHQLTIQGQTPLRNLFKGPPFAQILPYISDRRLSQPVWVTIRGRIRVEPAAAGGQTRHGEVEVGDFIVGKQPLGSFLPTILLGPSGGGLLRWPIPGVIDDIVIGDGQVVITTR